MRKVAFLGLGLMGRGMALNVLKAGYDLSVWNRSPGKAAPLVDAGAKAADSPAEAVRDADVIVTIVGDDDASEAVWLGDDGVLQGAKPGAIAIESTTVSHGWMVKLGDACTEAGLRFLDCPVTGGPPGAQSGQLTMLVGGEADVLDGARPVLESYAKRIYHFGPVGAGTAYKLIVNTIGAVQAAAVAEGMMVAKAAGLPLDLVAEALGSGSVASPMTAYIAPRMAKNEHEEVRFAAKWRSKDAGYGVAMAHELDCAVPAFEYVADLFARTVDAGLGARNESAIQRLIENG